MAEVLERRRRKMQKMYQNALEERKRFMAELKRIRGESHKDLNKKITSTVGPGWYQVLTVRQMEQLRSLQGALYRDILEGRPVRTFQRVSTLGLHPLPHKIDIENAMNISRGSPKVFLAELFRLIYEHPVSEKRSNYDLNMRILCSSLFYLGLPVIIELLEEMFKPDEPVPSASTPTRRMKRSTRTSLASPYLEKMEATPLWQPAPPKRKLPPPLPNLEFLNEHCERDEKPKQTPTPRAPTPPSSPRDSKRLSRRYCDQLADIVQIIPPPVHPKIIPTKKNIIRKKRTALSYSDSGSKSLVNFKPEKKIYGIGSTKYRKKKKTSAPQPPSVGQENTQYLITGVYTHKERLYYTIGGICILPPAGKTIHGGHARLENGTYVEINLGIRADTVKVDEECDCMEKWDLAVTRYLEKHKCRAGHYYDFGNEGSFTDEEIPYFIKPTPHAPVQFQYDVIYEMDPKTLHIRKELKKIWDNESLLAKNDKEAQLRRDKKFLKKRQEAKKESKGCCLGEDPDAYDYLRCALRILKQNNLVCTLPDLYLTPELKEWMRHRIFGALAPAEKRELLCTSKIYWSTFLPFYQRNFVNFELLDNARYCSVTTWKKKAKLNKEFNRVIREYKFGMYKSYSDSNNLLWGTLFHSQLPDKSIRDIFFTYLVGRPEDVCLARPYSYGEMLDFLNRRTRRETSNNCQIKNE